MYDNNEYLESIGTLVDSTMLSVLPVDNHVCNYAVGSSLFYIFSDIHNDIPFGRQHCL